jgi:peptidyl-prolyl cis-trans isomerase B (cyclophilin B)
VGGQTQLLFGQTRPVLFPVSPPPTDDSNAVHHDAAGLLSVRRGGGSFTFTLTPRPNPDLDRDEIVIGQVLNAEGMRLLERLNDLATNNYNRGALAKVVVERAKVLPP